MQRLGSLRRVALASLRRLPRRQFSARTRFIVLGAAGLSGAAVAATKVARAEAITRDDASPASSGEPSLAIKCLSEVVGTGLLMVLGCGVVSALKYCNYPIGPWGISAVWGSTVMLIVYATGDISGAHINPAITASMAINKPDEFDKSLVLPYWGSQMAGATIGSAINYGLFKDAIRSVEVKDGIKRGSAASIQLYNGAFGLVPDARFVRGPMAVLGVEIVATSLLGFFVFALTDPDNTVPKSASPAYIGATVMVLVNTFAPLTGCGMNPARDLGPRLVTLATGWGASSFSHAWLYTAGPLVGAVLGGALYQAFNGHKKKKEIEA